MKSLFISFSILLVLAITGNLYSQIIEIGNGTTTGDDEFPFYNYYENNKSQTLYLQSELGAPNIFAGISFNIQQIAQAGFLELQNFTINFKHTNVTQMTPDAYFDMSGATQVFYSASFTLATVPGWTYIDITDFSYNGTDNLVIEIIWGDNGPIPQLITKITKQPMLFPEPFMDMPITKPLQIMMVLQWIIPI
ncbi:MAG: hypothetical protein HY738_16165 [Bacteroidia bacterium]|nr:hypothetical protein [Bacteroidia bacterium]